MSIIKEKACQEMINNDANYCQDLLYTLQVKSREIQTKIQHDIDSINLSIDLKSLNNVCTERKSFESLLNTLATLKEELLATKVAIAEEHSTTNKQKIEKLKALEAILFYKRIRVKWASAELIEQLKLIKQLTQALSVSNMTKLPPVYFFRYKNGTSTQASSLLTELKDITTQFTTLVVKSKLSNLWCGDKSTSNPPREPIANPFANKTTDNAWPSVNADTTNTSTTNATTTNTTSSNAGTTNAPRTNVTTSNATAENAPTTNATTTNASAMNAVTTSATTTNVSTLNATTTNAVTNNLNHSFSSPTRDPIPTTSCKLESSSESTPTVTFNMGSTEPVKRITRRAIRRNGNNRLSTNRVRFAPLVGTDEISELGVTRKVTVYHQCITLMKEYENKSVEELRLRDYKLAAVEGRKYSSVFALPQEQLKNIEFFYAENDFKSNNLIKRGTMHHAWSQTVKPSECYESDETENLRLNYQCITCMSAYQSRSLEELRLDDYIARHMIIDGPFVFSNPGRVSIPIQQSITSAFFNAAIFNARWEKVKTAGMFVPFIGTESLYKNGVESTTKVKHQCITFMKEHEGKSLEEIRLDDYITGRSRASSCKLSFPQQQNPSFGTTIKGFTSDTTRVSFDPRRDYEMGYKVIYQCITLMPKYENKSLEELRLIDYTRASREGKQYPCKHDVFALSQAQLSKIAFFYATSLNAKRGVPETKMSFFLCVGTEEIKKSVLSTEVYVEYQCFTCMTEFDDRSLEEIRLDDYVAGRNDPAYERMKPLKKSAVSLFTTGRVRSRGTSENTQAESSTPTRESPTQKSQAPGCNPFTPWRESPTQKTQAFGRDSSTPTRETPTQKSPAPGRDPTTQPRETPIQKNQAFGRDSSTPTRETPTQKSQAPGCNPFTPWRDSPTQKNQVFGRDSSTPTRETPTQKSPAPERDPTTQSRETPIQKNQAFGRDSSTPTRETPTQKSPAPGRDPTTQSRETPIQKNQAFGRDSSTPTRETPTQKNQAPGCNPFTSWRESPTQKNQVFGRDSSTPTRETPTQKSPAPERDPTTQSRETPTQKNQAFGPNFKRYFTSDPEIPEKYEKTVETANATLELNPDDVVALTDRATAHYYLKNYKQALEDAQKVALLDSNIRSVHIILIDCCLKLGDITCGELAVKRAIELFGEHWVGVVRKELRELRELREKQEKARKLMDLEKYYDALDIINDCLEHYCPFCYKTKLMKAECLANNGKYQEAQDIAINLSLFERYDADAIYVVGLCLYNQNKDEQAKEHFRKVINLDPDHKKAAKMYKIAKNKCDTRLLLDKKNEGTEAYNNGDYEEALQLYNNALPFAKDNNEEKAKLYYNIACAYAKLDRTREAEQACTVALDLKQDYIKALERRALCCTKLGEHEDAVLDYNKLIQLYKQKNFVNDEINRLKNQAEKVLARFKKANYYYKILEVNSNATDSEIKQAYRRLSLLKHPDKVTVRPKEVKTGVDERATRRFRKIKEAYDALYDPNDPRKRANYDRRQKDDDDYSSDDYE